MEQSWAFQYERVPRDKGWLLTFALAHVGAIIGAFYGWTHRNPMALVVAHNPTLLADPAACGLEGGHREHGAVWPHGDDTPTDHEAAVGALATWFMGSLALSVLVALVYIKMFEKFPSTMTHTSAFGPPVMILAVVVAVGSAARDGFTAGFLALPGLFYLGVMLLWLPQLKLVSRLLKQSARCVASSPALVPVSFSLHVAQMLHLLAIALMAGLALTNGRVGVNPGMRFERDGVCYGFDDSDGFHEEAEVSCCMWLPEKWTFGYLGGVGLLAAWTIALYAEIRLFVVAGSVTQWYFLRDSANRTLRSLHHAVSSSLGSLCLSSVVVTACNFLRSLANPRSQSRNVFGYVLQLLVRMILYLLTEFIMAITDFATIQMSATGEAFFTAARNVTNMLRENFLDAAGVWLFPGRVLRFAAFMLAVIWGAVNYALLMPALLASGRANPGEIAVPFSLTIGLLAWLMLGYVAGVLTNTCKAMYICYARDRANGERTDPEVHAIYSTIPDSSGVVVRQPDDNLVFGAAGEEAGAATPMLHAQDLEAQELQPVVNARTQAIAGDVDEKFPDV